MLRVTSSISSDKPSNSNSSVPTPLSENAGRIERWLHMNKTTPGQTQDGEERTIINKCSLNAANIPFMGFPRGGNTGAPTSTRGIFKSQITDWDRMYFYTRDELTHKADDKYCGACINKWYQMKLTETEEGKREDEMAWVLACERLAREKQLQLQLFKAFRGGTILRAGYLGLTFATTSPETNYESEPKDVTDLAYITVYDKRVIEVKEIYDDRKSPKYGLPKIYKIQVDDALNRSHTFRVHESRLMKIVPFPFDDNIDGMSIIDHNMDKLLVKKSMDWTMGETTWRHVIPFLEVITPDDDDAFQDAKTLFNNGIIGKDVFTHVNAPETEGWEFKLHSPKNVLDPEPYYRNTISTLSAGLLVPKVLLEGAGAGTISGSTTNLDSFFSDVTAEQNMIISPFIRDFFQKMFDLGVMRKYGWTKNYVPDYIIDWNPPYELSGEELARQELMEARALAALKDAGIYSRNQCLIELGQPKSKDPDDDIAKSRWEIAAEAKAAEAPPEGENPDEPDDDEPPKKPEELEMEALMTEADEILDKHLISRKKEEQALANP